jgi:hypothetical protein
MDEKLSKALEFANYTRTIEDQKSALKEKYFDSLIFFHSGGQFTVNKSLITFVSILAEKTDSAVLLDDNENPIKIENLKDFYQDIFDLYFQSSNAFYTELQNLKNKRTIEKLVEYE